MADIILRAAAIEAFDDERVDRNYGDVSPESVIEVIKSIPAIDTAPVVHGRWIINKYGETVCSECDNNALQVLTGCLVNRHFEPHKSEFCPNCGAKMDGEWRDNI